MSAQDKLTTLAEEHARIIQEATAKIKSLVKENFSQVTSYFFESAPEIKAIAFTAYTPYFNDGEPCEFTIGEIYFFPTEEVDEESYNNEEGYLSFDLYNQLKDAENTSSWAYQYYSERGKLEEHKNSINEMISNQGISEKRCEELRIVTSEFEKFIRSNEDYLEALLGNNVFVVITKDSIRTDEYEPGY